MLTVKRTSAHNASKSWREVNRLLARAVTANPQQTPTIHHPTGTVEVPGMPLEHWKVKRKDSPVRLMKDESGSSGISYSGAATLRVTETSIALLCEERSMTGRRAYCWITLLSIASCGILLHSRSNPQSLR